MKKVLGIALGILLFAGTANAFWGDDYYTTNNYNTYNQPTANANADANADVDVTNKVKVKVKNKVDVKNTNVNLNSICFRPELANKQNQKQLQLQLQGQNQGQRQMNDWTQTYISIDKREHKVHSDGADARATHANGLKADAIKTKVTVLDELSFITYKAAKKLARDADDIEISRGLFKSFPRTAGLNLWKRMGAGEFMGSLTITSTGADVNADAALGRIWVAAMKEGATHMYVFGKDGKPIATARDFALKLGGGASIMSNDEDLSGSSGGGLGVSTVTSWRELVPSFIIKLYHDKSVLR